MKEVNYIFLHIVRAIEAADSKDKAQNPKAQLYYLALDAIKILKDRLHKEPNVMSLLSDPGEYTEKNWEEIEKFFAKENNLNEETLDKFHAKLNMHLHLELLDLYKDSIKKIKTFISQKNSNIDIQTEYDRVLKYTRSSRVLLLLKNFKNNPIYDDIKYIYQKTLTALSDFMLCHPDFEFAAAETFQQVIGDISEKTIERISELSREIIDKGKNSKYLSKTKADKHKTSLDACGDSITILENIFNNSRAYKKIFNPDIYQRLFLKACDGLISYYQWIDDQDNLLKVRSRKEIVGLSRNRG